MRYFIGLLSTLGGPYLSLYCVGKCDEFDGENLDYPFKLKSPALIAKVATQNPQTREIQYAYQAIDDMHFQIQHGTEASTRLSAYTLWRFADSEDPAIIAYENLLKQQAASHSKIELATTLKGR